MEMICPKAQNKTCEFNEECNSHNKPHKFNRDECFLPEDGCPACIEYKSEPTYMLVKLPLRETIKGILRQEVVIDEETITERSDTWKSHGGCMHEDYIDTLTEQIYASATPVDIEKLAELINKSADEWDKERINLNSKYVGKRFADYIKQAIEEFTGVRENYEKR